jgi:hypothetical protein
VVQDAPALPIRLVTVEVTALIVDGQAASAVASEATGDGAEYRSGGGHLQRILQGARQLDERDGGREVPGEARDEDLVVERLALVSDDAVATLAPLGQLVGAALADHAEPMAVIQVQEATVLARHARELPDVGRVARHRVHALDGDEPGPHRRGAEEVLEMLVVVVAEPLDGGAALRAIIAPSYRVLWARPSRKITPPASSGITERWISGSSEHERHRRRGAP